MQLRGVRKEGCRLLSAIRRRSVCPTYAVLPRVSRGCTTASVDSAVRCRYVRKTDTNTLSQTKIMILHRFCSSAEYDAFVRGEVLKNNTDHGARRGYSVTSSVGFCFFSEDPGTPQPAADPVFLAPTHIKTPTPCREPGKASACFACQTKRAMDACSFFILAVGMLPTALRFR